MAVTEEELASLREAFALYDINKNGAINVDDFATILKGLQIETDTNKAKEIVVSLDTNKDGKIDFNEFVVAMSTLLSTPAESNDSKGHRRAYSRGKGRHETDELKLCFARFDRNGDGLISTQELKQVMQDLGEHLTDREIADMMKDADTNSDGFIDFNEFKAIMPTCT